MANEPMSYMQGIRDSFQQAQSAFDRTLQKVDQAQDRARRHDFGDRFREALERLVDKITGDQQIQATCMSAGRIISITYALTVGRNDAVVFQGVDEHGNECEVIEYSPSVVLSIIDPDANKVPFMGFGPPPKRED